MRAEEKQSVKNSIGRLIFVGLSLIVQVGWIVLLFMKLSDYSTEISMVSSILAFLVVLGIYGNHMNAAFKMPWIILIMLFPVLGLCLYFLLGHSSVTKKTKEHFEKIDRELEGKLRQDEGVIAKIEELDFAVANQCRYISDYGKYPVYHNTDIVFYPDALEGLEAQLKELEQAEKFIFMEYHAIEDTKAFGRIREILAKKAKAGIDVRVIYDDVGSVGFISPEFIKQLQKDGILCRVFNPLIPILNVFMNNRDHRKITVVDGRVGFTGGYNLADEYFNYTHPYGQWKDTGVRLSGDAVNSLTITFLEMWNVIKKTDTNYDQYLPKIEYQAKEGGFVQPYADSPLDQEYVGENVYMNMIKDAKHEIFFTSPYLIISDEMNRELGMAAKRGVDVRIITPGIPDKKLIYKVTRSYYEGLVKNGVKIYEYTPGFLHAKQCVCDGKTAVVGTINMDYRSLYLHFENGVFFYNCVAVKQIHRDFEDTFIVSQEVTEEYRKGHTAFFRGARNIIRLFAPLM